MDIDKEQKKVKRKLKFLYTVGAVAVALIGGFVYTANLQGDKAIRVPETEQQEHPQTFMENNMDSNKKETVEENEEAKDNKEVVAIPDVVASTEQNQNPNLLKAQGKYFYLFDEDILLPLDTVTWNEYDTLPSEDGKYDKIAVFYVNGEDKDNWTQNVTAHRLNSEDKDCFLFVDKLVNGVIVSVSEQLAAKDRELAPDNLSFNYLSKDPTNTIMYWEMKNIDGTPDSTQFIRVFISPFSNKMYMMTYTLRTNLNSIPNEKIIGSMQMLQSIQELKKK